MMTEPQKNLRRRNLCAIAALVTYAISNLIGWTILRPLTSFAYAHAFAIIGSLIALGLLLLGFFVAFCCYGAKARGWSGWIGAPIALLGTLIWFGVAFCLLYQNVNTGLRATNEPRVYDDRIPWLVGVAFAVAALAIQLLPNRAERAERALTNVREA